MKILAIARNTFGSFLRNKLMILCFILFACVVLLMMTPLLGVKMMTTAENAQEMRQVVMGDIAAVMGLVSGVGSLLAAWAAADAVSNEMKSGTILAVMARPVRRWEYLLGKYLGVQLLMLVYVLAMFLLSYLLAWFAGEKIQSTPWVLIAYPLVRWSIYSAIAMLLVTVLNSIVTFGITMVVSVLAFTLAPPDSSAVHRLPEWARAAIYAVLPSTGLLSEDRFFTITQASLKQLNWAAHLTTLAYGLDYALVFLLLAMWSFHYRGLSRD
jgi:ABC-type transport system involved in multi-copper enzyme maturation permease subunit